MVIISRSNFLSFSILKASMDNSSQYLRLSSKLSSRLSYYYQKALTQKCDYLLGQITVGRAWNPGWRGHYSSVPRDTVTSSTGWSTTMAWAPRLCGLREKGALSGHGKDRLWLHPKARWLGPESDTGEEVTEKAVTSQQSQDLASFQMCRMVLAWIQLPRLYRKGLIQHETGGESLIPVNTVTYSSPHKRFLKTSHPK